MPNPAAIVRGAKVATQAAKTGEAALDLSKGFNIKLPKEVAAPAYIKEGRIPFRPNTDVEKARTWTKNFLRPAEDFSYEVQKHPTADPNKFQDFGELRLKSNPDALINFTIKEGQYRVQFSHAGNERGTGIGAALYKQLFERAEKDGAKVGSDASMSDASVAIWRRFKELGYPIIEHPMKKSEAGANFGKWVPDYKYRDGSGRGRESPIFEFIPTKRGESNAGKVSTASKKADE